MSKMGMNECGAFAVVQLKPGSETRLLKMLIDHGYTNVSFTNAKGESVSLHCEQDEDEEIDVEEVREIDVEEVRDPENDKTQEYLEKPWFKMQEGGPKQFPNINPPSPLMNFSSLTLPTVLLDEQSQPKFLNPFLGLPFLPLDHMMNLKQDIPPMHNLLAPRWTQPAPVATQQIMDTPPSTPRRSNGSCESSHQLMTGTKLRQRGRQLRRQDRDTSAYASCRLCRNRILANRLSNLHNHVRRHAVLKQFHCCYCSYAHTEVAKVRLHMLHNHKDDRTQPLDKRNDEMETAWSMLMKECFPGYA